MKKVICLVVAMCLILFCGCGSNDSNNMVMFGQTMTIFCNGAAEGRTTSNIADIEKTVGIFSDINKIEILSDWIGDWNYKIIITIDGQALTYMFGGKTFCDVDGTLYKVKNADQTREKISEMYDRIGN